MAYHKALAAAASFASMDRSPYAVIRSNGRFSFVPAFIASECYGADRLCAVVQPDGAVEAA